jgi:PAS domain S-box-containing protein
VTDLGGGWKVGAKDFLAAVLQVAAQPIWVVDPDGVIRFANPAAIAALGYDRADELFGRASHETIHYRHPDGSPYPASECPMLLPRATGETVASELDWFFRRDGSMFPVSYVSVPIDMPEGRGAVVAFNDIEERLRAERVLRERDAILARELDALRRVATLVAGGAASADVFAAVAKEVAHVLELPLVEMSRYDPEGTATVIGAWSERPHPFQAGTRWPLDGPTISARVLQTGRPARIDDFAGVRGTIADAVRQTGIRSGAGAPIIVDGTVWGVMATGATGRERLPDHIEDRLAAFTELVATAISNTQARDDLRRLADEQASLRRVATLVARQPSPAEVFAVVTREAGALLGAQRTGLLRVESAASAVVVAGWSQPGVAPLPVGSRGVLDGRGLVGRIVATGRPVRIEDYDEVGGAVAAQMRRVGVRSAVAGPIVLGGRIWGALSAAWPQGVAMPLGAEDRVAAFAELVAYAIENADTREELAASRARIVEAADEQRRRVVRDLHDGAQQRLVHAVMTLQLAHSRGDAPPELERLVGEALADTRAAIDELRELARGIHPALLTHRGLGAAVEALADRAPVPVHVEIPKQRYPALVESAAYFVAAEALTNVAKYASASRARVTATDLAERLVLAVADDGVGGATPSPGSGLAGLQDRVAALAGTLTVDSPPGAGTRISAEIPLPPPGSRAPVGAGEAAHG